MIYDIDVRRERRAGSKQNQKEKSITVSANAPGYFGYATYEREKEKMRWWVGWGFDCLFFILYTN